MERVKLILTGPVTWDKESPTFLGSLNSNNRDFAGWASPYFTREELVPVITFLESLDFVDGNLIQLYGPHCGEIKPTICDGVKMWNLPGWLWEIRQSEEA